MRIKAAVEALARSVTQSIFTALHTLLSEPTLQGKVSTLGLPAMPIQKLLQQQAFEPEEIKVLSSAFENALRELGLVDRTDPATQLVAKRIIELAQRGERDPIRLREGAVKGI
jgi:hypothetical protein